MVGIRKTDGSAGCSQTETPTSDYANPFRLDGSGGLWLRQCFEDFRYYGAARHDVDLGNRWIGSEECKPDFTNILSAKGINTGRYSNVTVTNDTQNPMQIMVGIDLLADIISNLQHMVSISLITRWNGAYHSSSGVSLPSRAFTNKQVRQSVTVSASPHDASFEGGGVPSVVLQPGETGTVSAKLSIGYIQGMPDGRDILVSASSAVRVYGHSL